jgi:hypothetical protein
MKRVVLALLLGVAGPLAAAAAPPSGSSVSLEGGIGFTSDPETFLLGFELPFQVAPGVEVGPLLQLGFADNHTIVAPTLNARYVFDLPAWGVWEQRPTLRRIHPMVFGGLGFAYIDQDGSSGDRDGTGFLFDLGFGAEYELTPVVSVGSRMTFNVLPDSVAGENFFFSWQVGTVRFRF